MFFHVNASTSKLKEHFDFSPIMIMLHCPVAYNIEKKQNVSKYIQESTLIYNILHQIHLFEQQCKHVVD